MRAVALIVAAGCGAAGCGAAASTGDRTDRVSRVLASPRDSAAHLSLAEYDYWHAMPGEALEQLQIVENLGGPLGVRWTAGHRAMMAHLLVERAGARIGRGAASGLADLEHAARLGATVEQSQLVLAKQAVAIAELRHVDEDVRAQGRALLLTLPDPAGAWHDHGRFGVWLWARGARREAYEQLTAWHHEAPSAASGAIYDAFVAANAWWSGNGPMTETPPAAPVGPIVPVTPQATIEALSDDARVVAAAHYAHGRFPGAASFDELLVVARAFRTKGVVADRLGRELVARQVDEAAGHAALGALYDALGDPARARTHWQAAVEAKDIGSAEPLFVRGLAEAAARAGDGPAAVVFATQAAAAWGDPAVVWITVGVALEQTGDHVSALVCARSALDLAGPDTMPRALDLAIEASHALGRQGQVEGLRVQRVAAEPPHATPEANDPDAAVVAYQALPTAGTIARMWVASRAHPADLDVRITLLGALPTDDPRRATVLAEVAAFAGDPDESRALAAVRALP